MNSLAESSVACSNPPGLFRRSITTPSAPCERISDMCLRISPGVSSVNCRMSISPYGVSGIILEKTDFSGTCPLTISMSIGSISPTRRIVRSTGTPSSPLITNTASLTDHPVASTPSTAKIRSPGLIPAFIAGESSIGDWIITPLPSGAGATVAPMPKNEPARSSRLIRICSGEI